MKKSLSLLTAACVSLCMMAQDFHGVTCREGQVFHNWHNRVDYINIVMPLNINRYEMIYLCPVDVSNVQLPDKSGKKYAALQESLEALPEIMAKHIKKHFPHLKVQTVNSLDELNLDDRSLGLCLRFDELDMGDLALRVSVGAGAGAQRISMAGVFFDKDKNEFFDFKKRHVDIIGRSYKKDLQLAFANFSKDIAKMLDTLTK